jgi:PAS domain S-box-containing protein
MKQVKLQPHGEDVYALETGDFYRLLINSIQDYAIFLMDTTGVIKSWNLGAQKLKGYKPSEIIGKHFSIFYSAEDLKNGKPAMELRICNKEGHVEDEGWRIKKDGGRFWANVIITALYNESGEHVGYAKVTRDLTERKKHEDALRAANDLLRHQRAELEALNVSKDEFISLASHQLRTPATGVKQFLGLVLEGYAGPLSEVQSDYLKRAYESNDRQIDLVNDLLRVARLDAGKVVLTKAATDINSLIKDVADEQTDSFKGRQQSLSLNLAAKKLMLVIDEMRFRMVLENLIDNASKYTPVGGAITVSLIQNDDGVDISVTDSGVGINESSIPKLFEKFSRIHNDLSDTVGGSGLGLYWAHKVISLHGGTIKVDSVPGKGSTFTIHLPKDSAHV